MTFFKRTIKNVPIDAKTVLVRADYNVPLNGKGEISDDLRIRASLPTLQYLLDHHCKVVVMSHLGRPEGRDGSLSPPYFLLILLYYEAARFATNKSTFIQDYEL